MGQNAQTYDRYHRMGSVEMSISPYHDPATVVELGIGKGFGYKENIERYNATPDNGEAPDTMNKIKKQTATITGSLWTEHWDNIQHLRGNIDTKTVNAVTGEKTYTTGGSINHNDLIVKVKQTMTRAATAEDVAEWVTTPTTPTVTFAAGDAVEFITEVTFHKCKYISGEAREYPSDEDDDPTIVYPFELEAEEDTTRPIANGDRLFSRRIYVALPS